MSEERHEIASSQRVLAAVCHLSAVIPLYGSVFCAAIWFASRKRGGVVAFQARQALTASLIFLASLLVPVVGLLLSSGLWLLSVPGCRIVAELNHFVAVGLCVVSWIVFAYAAYATYMDPRFRYPFTVDKLEDSIPSEGDAKPRVG